MSILPSVFLAAASIIPNGTIKQVHYVNGVCHVYVQGESESRKLDVGREDCETVKGLVGFNIDDITEK